MRNGALIVVLMVVGMLMCHTGCTEKKPEPEAVDSTDTILVDTIDTTTVDSAEQIIADTPMPKAADELFDDFFFNFTSNKKLQRSRILFPLTVKTDGVSRKIQRNEWRMDKFFRTQGYYTLIFDNAKQMALVKDTSVSEVTVEKVYLQKGTVEQYEFLRKDGKWLLAHIDHKGIEETRNASFLTFLGKFVTDDSFQMQSIHDPLTYVGPDPEGEDEQKIVHTEIPAYSWADFLPEVPDEMIYNILYGQHYDSENEKILMFKGISNGLETQLTFKRHGDDWKLVKLNAQ